MDLDNGKKLLDVFFHGSPSRIFFPAIFAVQPSKKNGPSLRLESLTNGRDNMDSNVSGEVNYFKAYKINGCKTEVYQKGGFQTIIG